MSFTLPAFQKTKVLVLGDVMLDRYWVGPTSRISPEAPVPVVRVDDIEESPGGAGNVALNLRSLGSQVVLVGLVGQDEAAKTLRTQFDTAGITHDLIPVADCPTVTKLRILSQHQQLIRLDFEKAFYHAEHDQLWKAVEPHLDHLDAVILSDYNKGTLTSPQALIERIRGRGIPVLVDPKGADFSKYQGATLLTPNRKEFEAVSGPYVDEDTLIDRAKGLILQNQLEALLITRGAQGMTLVERDQPPCHLTAHAKEVFDVTGAGDTVIAVFAATLAAKRSLSEAMNFANWAASIVVGKLGAASATPEELDQVLQEAKPLPTQILNEVELIKARKNAKTRGETVVMTNGCFDILHVGHIQYLEQAKALGDKLIVAVNDDASVAGLKGTTRPFNPLAERMAVLAGLKSVDWVVPFSEDTPQRLVSEVLPDILVKGGDYQISDIAGAEDVLSNGGRVETVCFVKGLSTSVLIEKIRKRN